MSDSLTTLISRVQAQLLDDGTRFSTATVTAAVRQTLRDFNQRAPIYAADLIEITATNKVYELSGGSFERVLAVQDVLLNDDDGDDDKPLAYDAYLEDVRYFIRLRTAETSGNLLVRFDQAHTISGLDSAAASTLTADQDQVIVDGACGAACQIRATGITEANNLNRSAIADLQRLAALFRQAFEYGVQRYELMRPPVSEHRQTSWLTNDIALNSTSQAGALKDL